MQAAGSLNGTITRPQMNLTFMLQLVRAMVVADVLPYDSFSPQKVWTLLPVPIPCFISPIKDELYFMQNGVQNIGSLEVYVKYGTDVRVSDRFQMVQANNVVGIPNGWFEITERTAPVTNLQHIRCFARVTDVPPGLG